MTISTGTRLGSYELLAQIGAGGMGEVYKAHDAKLGRDVAIKIPPEAFAHDSERLSRFQREAKMLAALNHPNIATIYGLEQSNGTSYLVLELVPGETLAERIKREGAVPLEEALKIAVQIAEALEAAHEKGIIHRDLKPANVKVTPEGKVKVLDFGLAKAFAGDTTDSNPSQSPTLSAVATMQGVLLGTAAYMSPEQARGKAVDKRSDIWAFGCVLYELLTGMQAFEGEDITEILAAVVKTEPDWSKLPESTPPSIGLLLRRCLQKDKALRMRDAGDARIEIQEALSAPALDRVVSIDASHPIRTARQAAVLALAIVVTAIFATLAAWNLKPTPPRPVTRTIITLPPGDQLAAQNFPAIAISGDGTQLAYVAIRSGIQQIFLRSLDSLEARPLVGTEGAVMPFFSPDGQWVGFFAGGKLKKVSASGGAVLALADASVPLGASWGKRGTLIFSPNPSGVEEVPDAGGSPRPVTRLEKGEGYIWPEFLPSSKALLFSTLGGNQQIAAQSLSSGERRNLVQGGTSPHYASSGHLLYALSGSLMAIPFDPERLQVTGAAVPVIDGITNSAIAGAQYSVSTTGSLAYVPGASRKAARLVWVTRNGVEQPSTAPPHVYSFLRLSPDGRRVAITISEEETQIWLYDFARETLSRFTFGDAINRVPAWTPDGKRIVFNSQKGGVQKLYWQQGDGSGGLEPLTSGENIDVTGSFSSDGQLLAFFQLNSNTGYDISVLRLSDRKVQPFLHTQFNEAAPAFSTDDRWLAYISDESGRYEVYVQPYPGPGGKYQISTEGGTEPRWNPNGRELFYRSGEKMMAVDVTTQPSFSVGKPRMLFQGLYEPSVLVMPYYDVSPDGQRFLMIKPSEQTSSSSPNQIVVVQNWFEELKRRVPTGK